jgi:ABC-type sugar transport system substrate-binding protein
MQPTREFRVIVVPRRLRVEHPGQAWKVASVAYVLAVAMVTGCEPLPSTPGRGRPISQGDLIILIGPGKSTPWCGWTGIEGGARRVASRYPPLKLQAMAPPVYSRSALMRVVTNAIAMKPKAVCLYVDDPTKLRPAVREITSAGVILVTMGDRIDDVGAHGQVVVDWVGGAELLGRHLKDVAGGKRSYLLVHSHRAGSTNTRCYERFMHAARNVPGITLLEERNVTETKKPADELLVEMFARFRHAGLAVTLDPTPWLSKPPTQLLGNDARFATLGAVPALWPYLRSGEASALVGPLDGDIGALAVELAISAITESRDAGVTRTVDCELVTPERISDFANRYAAAAGLDRRDLPLQPESQPASGPTDRAVAP